MARKLLVVIGLVLASAAVQAATREIVEDIKESVKDNWRKVAEYSNKITELRDEMKSLPDKSWWCFTTDKRSQVKKIKKQLHKVRSLLLSTNAQEILEEVDEIDRDIAELNEDIRVISERRTLNLDKREKYTQKLDKLYAKRAVLDGQRKERAQKVCAELRALGLNMSGEAAENCLFTVNFGDLIDGVVVAKNVAAVVENLRELMSTGDIAAARRYFGMYLVMVDVQVSCFEDYLDKSRNGEWRGGINRIMVDATVARDMALANAQDNQYSTEQQRIFRHNAKVNDSTIRAAKAYLEVLDAHEAVIAQKLAEARKVRVVVASSYETINLAGDFVKLAKSSQDAFDALLKLDLPPIQMFNDEVVQQEFLAITRRLKE